MVRIVSRLVHRDRQGVKRIRAWMGLVLLAGSPFVGRAETQVTGGDVSGTWTVDGSPYTVAVDVSVPQGSTLTVEAGVEVKFVAETGMTVFGNLVVAGTAEEPALFTSTSDTPADDDWKGVTIRETSYGTSVSHVIIEYATTGISCIECRPVISDCEVHNCRTGISVSGYANGCDGGYSAPAISRCDVHHCDGAGVSYWGAASSVGCTPAKAGTGAGTLVDSRIHHNGTGIALSAYDGYRNHGRALPIITRCAVFANQTGIKSEGDGRISPEIANCLIHGNAGTGVLSDGSEGTISIRNSIVFGNNVGIDATEKGLDHVEITYSNIWANTVADFGGLLDAGYGDLGYLNEVGRPADSRGNISVDPLFVDEAGDDDDPASLGDNDYHLQTASPCVDAGDPSGAAGDEPDPNNGLTNQGLYGGTAQTAVSPWVAPVFTATPEGGTRAVYHEAFVFDFGSDVEGVGGEYGLSSYGSEAVVGAIDPDTGVYTWTTTLADSGTTRRFYVVVTNGDATRTSLTDVPPLAMRRTFCNMLI